MTKAQIGGRYDIPELDDIPAVAPHELCLSASILQTQAAAAGFV